MEPEIRISPPAVGFDIEEVPDVDKLHVLAPVLVNSKLELSPMAFAFISKVKSPSIIQQQQKERLLQQALETTRLQEHQK